MQSNLKLLLDRLKDNCKRDYNFARHFTLKLHNAQIRGLLCDKTNHLIKSVYHYYTKRYQRPLSPPEREYETVLECAYSKILESRFFVSGTCILDSNRLRDSGFHQHKFPGFWNLDSLKKDDNLVDNVNFFTPTVMEMSILHAISNRSVYNTKLLNRNMVFLIPTTLPARKVRIEITMTNSK